MDKEKESEEARARIEELLELARHHNEVLDDHGPVILGERAANPLFLEEK